MHTVILPTWAAWTGRAQVQGQPGVSTKFKVSLGETLSKNKNTNIESWEDAWALAFYRASNPMCSSTNGSNKWWNCTLFLFWRYPRRTAELGKQEELTAELKINKLYLLLCHTQTSFITKLEEGNTRLSCQGFLMMCGFHKDPKKTKLCRVNLHHNPASQPVLGQMFKFWPSWL